MAVYSMTGYASGQQAAGQATPEAPACRNAHRLGLELRSVNSRFLDIALRLPEELRQHEPALRELLGKHLKRGKVELRASFDSADPGGALPAPSPRVLQQLAALQDQVRAWLPDAPPLSTADALRLASGADTGASQAAAGLLPLAEQVLQDFVQARAREGERLAGLLMQRLADLRRLASQAEPVVPQAVQAQKQRFLDRWAEALSGADASGVPPEAAQERALAEATAFAIRIDVAEELGRLRAHLDEIEAVLEKGGSTGKRLDFIIQELHREANTLGSKSSSLELTRISVDMKVLIEQMREQVQNLE